jgi:hypothetical protein
MAASRRLAKRDRAVWHLAGVRDYWFKHTFSRLGTKISSAGSISLGTGGQRAGRRPQRKRWRTARRARDIVMGNWRPGFKHRALGKAGQVADGNSLEDFLWQVHEYTNEHIRFADTKAAFIVAASTALISALVASLILDSLLRRALSVWSGSQWIAAFGLLLLSASVVLGVVAIRPRLWNKTPVGFIFLGGHR